MFGTTLLENPIYFFLWALAIVLGMTIHEFSHALIAYWQGDRTAEDAGRLTLNPIKHIDIFGFLLLLLIGFGWAKPTPFNPYNLKFKRFGSALVALAGPISNLLVAIVIAIAIRLVEITLQLPSTNLMMIFFLYLIHINILLAVFNCIPIPPLDGSKVLYTFIFEKYPNVVLWLERYGTFVLLGLIFFGGGIIQSIVSTIYNWIFNIVFWGAL
ncbi:MAG: site-2 protease family protein [Candidatus Kerfeldbacteria bacterium]|nr:site-2 protease family protein [Candidatus Kerfeldbacteria bacterium]